MTLIFESWGKSVGGTGIMPKFEDLHKEAVKKFGEEPLTGAAEQRYRRVLGQLAWQHFQEQIYLFQFRFCFVFRQNPILRLNIAWGHFWNGWPCIFILHRECQQLSVLMLESRGKSFHFVMLLGVWIQCLDPSLSTRGLASNSFRGSRKFQLCHLLKLKSFPLLKQQKKWYPLECCCKQWFRESSLIL